MLPINSLFLKSARVGFIACHHCSVFKKVMFMLVESKCLGNSNLRAFCKSFVVMICQLDNQEE